MTFRACAGSSALIFETMPEPCGWAFDQGARKRRKFLLIKINGKSGGDKEGHNQGEQRKTGFGKRFHLFSSIAMLRHSL